MSKQIGPKPSPRVLIVGGASGIGRAIAEYLASQGAELILADHDGPALHATANALGAQSLFCDVLSEASVAVFCDYLAARFDSIDLLINAAGKQYVRTLGMVRMSVAILPLLRRSASGGQILNIASAEHFASPASPFPYASSRESFLRCSTALLERVRGSAISVSAIVLHDGDGATGNVPGHANDGLPGRSHYPPGHDFDRVARHVSRLVANPVGSRFSAASAHSAGRSLR